jgi:hypothetical protein
MDPIKQRFNVFRVIFFVKQQPGPASTRYHQEIERLMAAAFEIPIGRDRRAVDTFHLVAIPADQNDLECDRPAPTQEIPRKRAMANASTNPHTSIGSNPSKTKIPILWVRRNV